MMSKFLIALAILLLFAQIGQLSYFLAQNADIRPIVGTLDNDAANAIDVAGRSQWYRDNGFSGYGPVYFRLANTLASWMTPLTAPGEASLDEARTKTIHLALTYVSLLSLIGLGILLAHLVFEQWSLILLVAALWVRVLLESPICQKYLLVAHPDHLLALITALCSWLLFRMWLVPEQRGRANWAAVALGVALATKMSMILFYPVAFLTFVYTLRPSRREIQRFIGLSAAAYFAIGFPQNFNLPRLLRFLRMQSAYNTRGDAASIGEWLSIYGPQMFWPVLLLAGLGAILFCFSRYSLLTLNHSEKNSAPRTFVRSPKVLISALVLGWVPFGLVILQKVNVPHSHYLLPFIASQLVLAVLVLKWLCKTSRLILPARIERNSVLLLLAVFVFIGVVPLSMNATLNTALNCRAEARVVYARIQKLQSEDHSIFIDPYVPAMDHAKNITSSWFPTVDYVVQNKFDILVLRSSRYPTYFTPEGFAYQAVENKNAEQTRAFYQHFYQHDLVTDAVLGAWHKTYVDTCGIEIWQVGSH